MRGAASKVSSLDTTVMFPSTGLPSLQALTHAAQSSAQHKENKLSTSSAFSVTALSVASCGRYRIGIANLQSRSTAGVKFCLTAPGPYYQSGQAR